MKQIFLILASILVFSSVGEDTIKIHFNGKTFAKPFPKTYNEASATIKSMEYLFNSYDSTYTVLSSAHDSLKQEVSEFVKYQESYLNEIQVLSKDIDSLNDIVLVNALSIKASTRVYSDSIKYLLSKIEQKPLLNVGLKVGANSSFDSYNYSNYQVSPLLIYKRLFASLNFGVYCKYPGEYTKLMGIDVGILLR
jgi:hypothetical protein